MKDKVASILGESKSTHASSHNKISNSHNEESNSENKPRFYRRDINNSNNEIKIKQENEQKWLGTNFRIVKSPGKREPSETTANIARVTNPNSNSFVQNALPSSVHKPKGIGKPRQLPNMGLVSNTYASRNAGFSSKF